MKKRIILPAIVIIAFLLNIGLNKLYDEAFLGNISFIQISTYEGLIILTSLTTCFLSIVFNIIIITCFRNYKELVIFSSISIIVIFSFTVYSILIVHSNSWTITLRIFAAISYFGSIINFFVSFGIVLQDYYDRLVNRSLMFFSVVNYVFASYYTQFAEGFLARLVGDLPPGNLERTFEAYDNIYLFIQLIMAVLAVLVILNLLVQKEMDKNVFVYVQFKEEKEEEE